MGLSRTVIQPLPSICLCMYTSTFTQVAECNCKLSSPQVPPYDVCDISDRVPPGGEHAEQRMQVHEGMAGVFRLRHGIRATKEGACHHMILPRCIREC